MKEVKLTVEEYYNGAINNGFDSLLFFIEYLTFEKELLTPDEDGEKLINLMRELGDELEQAYFEFKKQQYKDR